MTQVESATRPGDRLEVSVRKATRTDVPALTGVLARAFDDDPMANWFIAQDERRQERIAQMQRVSLERIALPQGEVYTTDGLHGASLWAPPGKWKMGLFQQLLLVPPMSRATGVRRIPKVLGGINAIEKKHPAKPHYYLFVLGTEPEHQGRGVGTQLMRPVLERCDREGVPAYLESSKEKNLPLYERNGFRVTEVFQVPNGGPPLWLMWRDPQ
jgi:ribosomal protein S18 acetylase RimI-like enzyme